MNAEQKYAKLLALSVLYEKNESTRTEQVKRITCCSKDVDILLTEMGEILNKDFKDWIRSVAHLFKT